MINYSSTSSGFTASVENIITKEKYQISTIHSPLTNVYETIVVKASNSMAASIKTIIFCKYLFVEYSVTSEEAQKMHARVAELFEKSNPHDIVRKYQSANGLPFWTILQAPSLVAFIIFLTIGILSHLHLLYLLLSIISLILNIVIRSVIGKTYAEGYAQTNSM